MAHTGFPIRIPEGFQQRNPVSFLTFKEEQHVLHPEMFCSGDTLSAGLYSRDVGGAKTKQLDGADQTASSFKAQNRIPQRQ